MKAVLSVSSASLRFIFLPTVSSLQGDFHSRFASLSPFSKIGLALASQPIIVVPIKIMGIRRKNLESSIRNVFTI